MIKGADEVEELDLLDEVARVTKTEHPVLAKRAEHFFRWRSGKYQHAVPKLAAAAYLAIHDDTLNDWLKRGILEGIRPTKSQKEFVRLESLLRVKHRVDQLKRQGLKRNFAAALLAGLDEDGVGAEEMRRDLAQRREGVRGVRLPVSWYEAPIE